MQHSNALNGNGGSVMSETSTRKSEIYHIQSVQRAFRILRTLSREKRPMSLSEITREVGFHKSVCHRLLVTLSDEGVVKQNDLDGKYRVGIGLFTMGQSAADQIELTSAAKAAVSWLTRESGESAYLSVESDGWRVCLQKEESPHTIRHYIALGEMLPLFAGAGGKVLLAAYTRAQFEAYVADHRLEMLGRNAIIDPVALWLELETVRRDGFAWSFMERTADGASIGVPVRDYTGAVVASIAVAGPSDRFTDEVRHRLIELTRKAGDDISSLLGFRANVTPERWESGRVW